MKKNETMPAAGRTLAVSVLTGLVVTLLAMAVCAGLILLGVCSESRIAILADACLGLGSFCAAFQAARRTSGSRLLWGLAAGALLFGCLVLFSFAWIGEPVRMLRLFINAALAILCATAGAALGAGRRKRRRHRK